MMRSVKSLFIQDANTEAVSSIEIPGSYESYYPLRIWIKVIALSCLILIVSTACGKGSNKTSETTNPMVTEVTPTIEPTATTEPTVEPTEAPRYTEILPATLEECKANNVIRWSNFEEDWKEFTDLVDAKAQINGDLVEPFVKHISTAPSPPSISFAMIKNPNKQPGAACACVEFDDGSGVYVFGIPIKRPDSPNIPVTVLYFGVDKGMLDKYIYDIHPELKGTGLYEKYYDLSSIYPKLVSGNYIDVGLPLIISFPGLDESDPIWGNLIKIYYRNGGTDDASNNYYPLLFDFFSAGSKLKTEQMAIDALAKLKNKIIPISDLSVVF
jgi:hypothetical protein